MLTGEGMIGKTRLKSNFDQKLIQQTTTALEASKVKNILPFLENDI